MDTNRSVSKPARGRNVPLRQKNYILLLRRIKPQYNMFPSYFLLLSHIGRMWTSNNVVPLNVPLSFSPLYSALILRRGSLLTGLRKQTTQKRDSNSVPSRATEKAAKAGPFFPANSFLGESFRSPVFLPENEKGKFSCHAHASPRRS